jgi:hypothetical protein
MNNGDQPAAPTLLYNESTGERNGHRQGLTKREMIAAMALQGILSGIYGGGGDNYLRQMTEWHKQGSPLDNVGAAAARDAIGYADELLKQLETK